MTDYVFNCAVHCYRCICCGWTWSSAKEPTRCNQCGGQLRAGESDCGWVTGESYEEVMEYYQRLEQEADQREAEAAAQDLTGESYEDD